MKIQNYDNVKVPKRQLVEELRFEARCPSVE